jgi:hypothetical protein
MQFGLAMEGSDDALDGKVRRDVLQMDQRARSKIRDLGPVHYVENLQKIRSAVGSQPEVLILLTGQAIGLGLDSIVLVGDPLSFRN